MLGDPAPRKRGTARLGRCPRCNGAKKSSSWAITHRGQSYMEYPCGKVYAAQDAAFAALDAIGHTTHCRSILRKARYLIWIEEV